MTARPDDDFAEIRQELLLLIEEYGLTAVLENFSQLPVKGHLAVVGPAKLKNIATYLAFAADTASEDPKD